MQYKISPHYTQEKLNLNSIDDLIDVFEDRMIYWIFEPASILMKYKYGEISLTALLLPYFEAIRIYLIGEDSKYKSKRFFREGFIEVFGRSGMEESYLTKLANDMYKNGRCGFFHDACFNGNIMFSILPGVNDNSTFINTHPKIKGFVDKNSNIKSILINPVLFFEDIKSHFEGYLNDLRNPENVEVRSNFLKAFMLKCGLSDPPVEIGLDCPTT